MEEQDNQMKNEPVENVARQEASVSDVSGKSANSRRFTMTVVALIIIIAAGVAFYVWHSKMGTHSASQATAAVHYPAVVATVNGEDIPGSDLEKSVKQTQSVASQQGADLTDSNVQTEIQTQALSLLVNATLLTQAATKAGITASSSGIDAQYAAIEAQFGGADKLKAQMDSDGLTEADLRKNIQQQMVIKAYLEKDSAYADIAVSDADVAAAYASFKAQSGNSTSTPALADIAPQIKDQLTQQKQQDVINTIIDGLRASSTIKMNI